MRMLSFKKLRKLHKEEFPNLYFPPGNIGRVIRLKEDKPNRTCGTCRGNKKYSTEITPESFLILLTGSQLCALR
jgi:hypothetical protein